MGDSGAGYRPQATAEALEHSAAALGVLVTQRWFETEEVTRPEALESLSRFDGIWVVPGSPYKSLDGVLSAIRLAREQEIPLLGTCAGFQHLILEYVRNVLGLMEAVHAEYDPSGKDQAISRLACSLVGRTQEVIFEPSSMVGKIYGRNTAEEQFYCNYGVNSEFVPALRSSNLRMSGWDKEGAIRVVELADHPFFVGTLFIPQFSSLPEKPHPLVSAFLRATASATQSSTECYRPIPNDVP